MRKLRSIIDLQLALDEEFSWRLQELQSLRKVVVQHKDISQKALLRSSVPILYAHWEGFVKNSAIKYGWYLSCQNLTYGDLQECFSGLKALVHVQNISDIKRKIFTPALLLKQINSISNQKVAIRLEDHITEIGNLNFDMLEQILGFLAIDPSTYSGRRVFIDRKLLAARNVIAHGKDLDIDVGSFEDIHIEVIGLMRSFKTDVENSAIGKLYKR